MFDLRTDDVFKDLYYNEIARVRVLEKELGDLKKDFEIVRTASRLFEQAANVWQERALKAEAK